MIFLFLITYKEKVVFEERLTSITASDPNSRTLLVGVIQTLKSLGQFVAPSPAKSFNSFTTSNFKIHTYRSCTGWEFIFVTSPDMPDLNEMLKNFYTSIFIPQVLLDPLRDPQSASVATTPLQTHLRSFLANS
jgi:hypothetical protein